MIYDLKVEKKISLFPDLFFFFNQKSRREFELIKNIIREINKKDGD